MTLEELFLVLTDQGFELVMGSHSYKLLFMLDNIELRVNWEDKIFDIYESDVFLFTYIVKYEILNRELFSDILVKVREFKFKQVLD